MEAPIINEVSFSVLDAISNLPGHQYGYYRILTASSAIKYFAFLPLAPTFPDIPDFRAERLGFATVPPGDWNMGYLDLDVATDRLALRRTEKAALQGVQNVWHPARVDYLALGQALYRDELQCARQFYSSIHPGQFGADQVVVNTEWYPDSIFGVIQETRIYSLIEGHGIGPRFLAHVTENGERVYGYILESLPARQATLDDLQACKAVLAKLHGRRILHGRLSALSFMIVDGRAFLHYFGGSILTDTQSLFDREMASVEDVLRRGLPPSTEHISDELRAEIFAISQRDDGIHPEILRQAAEEGKITLIEEEHKGLLSAHRKELREVRSHSKPIATVLAERPLTSEGDST